MKALIGRLLGAQKAGGRAQETGFAKAASRNNATQTMSQRGVERRRRNASSVAVERRRVDRRDAVKVISESSELTVQVETSVLMTGTDSRSVIVPINTRSIPESPVAITASTVTAPTPQNEAQETKPATVQETPALALVGNDQRRTHSGAALSQGQILAELGRPWRGCLGGLVAHDHAQKFAVLDMTCAQVVLVCTQDVRDSTHYHAVKSRIDREWQFTVVKTLIGTPQAVADIAASVEGPGSSLDLDRRYLRVYDDIYEAAVTARASDIHFETVHGEGSIRLRVYGQLRSWLTINAELMLHCIGASFGSRGKESTATKEQFSAKVPVAFMSSQKVAGRQWEGRYNGRPHSTGYKGVLRLLESSMRVEHIPTLAGLGYSPSQVRQLDEALARQWGLIVIFGSTGSGKSTTLRTMMVHMKDAERLARFSCESPVEYEMPGVTQFSLPVDVNMSSVDMTAKFTALLRDSMRMDPDVLMMGEIRDHESGRLATEFTLTDHRCFTTVHGSGAIDGLGRMTGDEIRAPSKTLAGARFLNAGIYQKLLPLLCKHCRIPATDKAHGLSAVKREVLAKKFKLDAASMFIANTRGCQKCKPKVQGLSADGTMGVTVAAEIFIPTAEMHPFIAVQDWPGLTRMWRSQRRAGFAVDDCLGKTAGEHALWLASQGLVSLQDIEAVFEPIESMEVLETEAADGVAA